MSSLDWPLMCASRRFDRESNSMFTLSSDKDQRKIAFRFAFAQCKTLKAWPEQPSDDVDNDDDDNNNDNHCIDLC